MTFIELTFMTQDNLDGKKFHIHVDEIRVVSPHELFKEKIPDLAAGERKRHGSIIKVSYGWQGVAETPDEVMALIDDASWNQAIDFQPETSGVQLLNEETNGQAG